MTVLDALFHVLEKQDGSLAFRYSCRSAVCGSCAMFINGRQRLACKTQISTLGRNITIGPLPHLPIIRDLVVDLEPFFHKIDMIKPYFEAQEPLPDTRNPTVTKRPRSNRRNCRLHRLRSLLLSMPHDVDQHKLPRPRSTPQGRTIHPRHTRLDNKRATSPNCTRRRYMEMPHSLQLCRCLPQISKPNKIHPVPKAKSNHQP